MIADELVELGELRRRLVEPIGEALVQLRAQTLRRRAVDGLLHEDVAEPERAVPTRPHEAAAGQRLQVRVGGRRGVGIQQRHDVLRA